jgi:tetratricopeptide (TPR) repeat protein
VNEAVAAFRRGDLDRARALAAAAAPSAQVHHLLGLIDCRAGRLDSGIESLRRASEAEPANAAFRVMLARALVDAGRAKEALDTAQPPPGNSPPEMALWHVRAEAADAVGDREASAEAWGRLCAARADDWRAWNNHGHALAALGRWAGAASAFRRAADLNPGELSLRRALAAALARSGKYQESADELGRWVEASPNDAGTRIMFARLLFDLGRNDEAQKQLDKAAKLAGVAAFDESSDSLMDIAGNDLNLLKELARLLERSNRMEALSGLVDAAETAGFQREQLGFPAAAVALRQGEANEAKRLLLGEPPEADPVRWHWLMARIEDALGNPEAAFAAADAMHRSANDYEGWRARGAAHLDFVRRLASAISPEWIAGLKIAAADERSNPTFLVGFPRSGTTLLDTFLMGHPKAAVLEEVPLLRPVEAVLGQMTELPERSLAQVEQARDAYFAEFANHVDPGFAGLVVDKMPLNMIAMPFLHCLFPRARVVFAQRHPCDAVLSCFMQGFALNDSMACFLDIETAGQYYDAAMSVWQRSRQALPLNVHTLVYEELVADPEAALRPLIRFLGLDWRDELLDHRATARARGGIGTPSYNQVTQPLSRSASGRWKRYEKQLEPVLPLLLPWAERLGYRD